MNRINADRGEPSWWSKSKSPVGGPRDSSNCWLARTGADKKRLLPCPIGAPRFTNFAGRLTGFIGPTVHYAPEEGVVKGFIATEA